MNGQRFLGSCSETVYFSFLESQEARSISVSGWLQPSHLLLTESVCACHPPWQTYLPQKKAERK